MQLRDIVASIGNDALVLDVDMDDWHILFVYLPEIDKLLRISSGHDGLGRHTQAILYALGETAWVAYTHDADDQYVVEECDSIHALGSLGFSWGVSS